MLELKRLTIFREVARRGSFSAAASALSYTQPAVSHHIAQLELEIGARLIEREPRGLRLTTAGATLLKHTERVIAEVEDTEAALAEVTGHGGGRVRLGAFPTAGATVVADAVAALRRSHADAEVTCVVGEAADALARLRAREIDIAVVFDHPSRPVPVEDLSCTYVHDDAMLIALPRGHRLAERPALTLEALADERWIDGAGEDTPASLILLEAASRAGFTPKVAFSSGDYQVVQRLVAVGVGVALLPAMTLIWPHPDLVIRPVAHDDPPVRRIAVVLRRSGHRSAATDAMVTHLRSACACLARRRPWWEGEPPRRVHAGRAPR
jgi:DNA-binding transcriptional LysR family regulator